MKKQTEFSPKVQEYDFTRPLKRQRVDLPSAAALLIAAHFAPDSLIRVYDRAHKGTLEETSDVWACAKNEKLIDTYEQWIRMRYELETYRNSSAEAVFNPVILGYNNGKHHAIIWKDIGDLWIPAYGVIDLMNECP